MPNPLPIERFRKGMRLPMALHDRHGEQLFPAGYLLTGVDMDKLKAVGEVYPGSGKPADRKAAAGTARSVNGGRSRSVATKSPPVRKKPSRSAQDSTRVLQGDSLGQSVDTGENNLPAPTVINPFKDNDEPESYLSVRQFKNDLYASILSGLCLPKDILDQDGVLLLAAGTRITPRFLQLLRDRGIKRITLREPEPDAPAPAESEEVSDEPQLPEEIHTEQSRKLDERLGEELQRPIIIKPVQSWRRPTLALDGLKANASIGLERHAAASAGIADICEQLRAERRPGERVSQTEVRLAIGRFVKMAAFDFDLLPLILSMSDVRDEYLFDHSVNVTLLSIAMAYQMGLDHDQIMEIGVGALLQDVGMIKVPLAIRLAPRKLTPQERTLVERHPIDTIELLEEISGVPRAAKIIAYQVHERMDGTGYPRRRTGPQIHQFARIVAAADAYTAMTRPRPHRPAMLPYEAAKHVLFAGSQAKLDNRIVRAFLDTVSLFPVGSFVELSNGVNARVVRAIPGSHTRPVVEILDRAGQPTGEIIELAKEEDLKVIRGGARVRK